MTIFGSVNDDVEMCWEEDKERLRFFRGGNVMRLSSESDSDEGDDWWTVDEGGFDGDCI